VLVQYKSMNKGAKGPEFRWQENDQLADEIARMDTVLAALGKLPQDQSPANFRLHANPFFLKLCARTLFNPDDKGLFSGMYLPLDLWRSPCFQALTNPHQSVQTGLKFLLSRGSPVRVWPGAPSLSSVFNNLEIRWLETLSPLSPVFDLRHADGQRDATYY
jgi:hypothetical protein